MGANGGSAPTLPIKMEVICGLQESETPRVVRQVVAEVLTTDLRCYNRGGFGVLGCPKLTGQPKSHAKIQNLLGTMMLKMIYLHLKINHLFQNHCLKLRYQDNHLNTNL